MFLKCPGADKFRQSQPESIKCPACGQELEIWTDEIKAVCPKCSKTLVRKQGQCCLDWCKAAKECVGDKVYNKRLKELKEKLKKDRQEVKKQC